MFNFISHLGNANQNQNRYHFTPPRITIIKRQAITSVGKKVQKLEPSHITGWNVKQHSHFGKLAVPQKVKCSVAI